MCPPRVLFRFLALPGLALAPPVWGADSAEIARIDAAAWSYIVFASSVTLIKIAALLVGYFVVKLGYTTMMAGVQGKDSVELKLAGARFIFKGVTPGLALGTVGVFMMIWALSTKHHFTTEASSSAGWIAHRDGAGEAQRTQKPGAGKAEDGRTNVEKPPKF